MAGLELEASMDLTRRLAPAAIERTLDALCALVPDVADDLLGSVDQPLKILKDDGADRNYLACDYNRDQTPEGQDAYRSPWSNVYTPALEDGQYPEDRLRELELAMNAGFDTYREMYFESGSVSSVYLWSPEDDKDKFAGVVLLKKVLPAPQQGSWDSIHVFEAHERGRTASYKLTSTVMLRLASPTSADPAGGSASQGEVELAGSLTRQTELDGAPLSYQGAHVANVGRAVEDMEMKLRNLVGEIYFAKCADVVNDVRSFEGLDRRRTEDALRRELMAKMKR